MNVLEVKSLTKQFGTKTVLRDISFTIPSQCIFGFLGQNGAGKTTTMKLILGLSRDLLKMRFDRDAMSFLNSLDCLKLIVELVGFHEE